MDGLRQLWYVYLRYHPGKSLRLGTSTGQIIDRTQRGKADMRVAEERETDVDVGESGMGGVVRKQTQFSGHNNNDPELPSH